MSQIKTGIRYEIEKLTNGQLKLSSVVSTNFGGDAKNFIRECSTWQEIDDTILMLEIMMENPK